MNTKYFNQSLNGSDLSVSIGDQYHGQDRMRDFWNQKEYAGILAQSLVGELTDNIILFGCYVTQGAGHTISITAGKVLTKLQIKPPSDWSTIPPTMANVDIPIIAEVPALTDQAIASAVTDSSTPNYVKIAYLETAGSSRAKAVAGGSYNSEVTPSYTLTCDDSVPTAYETVIATFTSDGATLTFTFGESGYKRLKTVTGTYQMIKHDYQIRANGTFTVTLPAVADCYVGFETTIKNIGSGTITIEGSGAETIDGALNLSTAVQYESFTLICTGTSWDIK